MKQNQINLLSTVSLLVVMGLLGLWLSRPVRAASPQTARATPTATPASSATYQGIPVGLTAAGHPYIGQPDAPIVLQEFSDFLCPFCGRHFSQTYPALLDKYVRTGLVQYVYRDFPIASLHPTAPKGAAAAQCVAEQGVPLFWAMHDQLFRRQQEWGATADLDAFLADLAGEVGADLAQYKVCMAAPRATKAVSASIAEGEKLGFNATPSFQFVNQRQQKKYTLVGAMPVETFIQWIDALQAGKEPPKEPEAPKPELPFWAKPEGLTPSAEHPGQTVAGDHYLGDPDAPVTVVTFSDFQCPACAKHALENQPAISQALVESGQVRWVFKHFPLLEHAQAPVAAAAAECAAVQGKFWPMHDLLFQEMESWVEQETDAALIKLAATLGLNRPAFQSCLNSRQALEPVLRDLLEGQGVIRQTPTFIVLFNGQGTLLRGAMPADQFIATVEGLMKQAQTK